MSYVQAAILGILQGIAEFLPISSSGHLVLAEAALDLQADNLAFNVAVHVGTLLSILLVYRHEVRTLLSRPRIIVAVVVATLPIVVVGGLLRDELEQAFHSPLVAGMALCATASLLWMTRWVDRGETDLAEVNWKQALVVGVFQAIAPIPGISRSGVTIFAGLLAGMNRHTAATFSFLIAIPAILGAATLETWSISDAGELSQSQWRVYGLGMAVAFVVGVLALKGLLRVISARKLYTFAWYCLAVGILAIVGSVILPAASPDTPGNTIRVGSHGTWSLTVCLRKPTNEHGVASKPSKPSAQPTVSLRLANTPDSSYGESGLTRFRQ